MTKLTGTPTYNPETDVSYAHATGMQEVSPATAWTAGQMFFVCIFALCVVGLMRKSIMGSKKKSRGLDEDDDYYTAGTKDPTTGNYNNTKKKF